VLCLVLLTVASSYAQVLDNFMDGDFTNNPTWNGETTKFEVSASRLHLNAPAIAETAYLSTASTAIHNGSWEFYTEMGFQTSSTSLTRVYLVSDQADLKQSLNGYFVMIGNTADEVSLYKQAGTTITKIIDGLDARVGAATVIVKVKVTRDASGLWSLYSDVGNTGTYTQEASSVNDVTYTASNYFGVYCLYTATRSTLFWFDDMVVTGTPVPDLTPPAVTSVIAINSTSVLVSFNETIESTSAQTASNYSINQSVGNPASAVIQADNKSVLLNLATSLTNGVTHTIQVSGVQDANGNAMGLASNPFLYFVQLPVNKEDVIVSEFMADPSPIVGLPESEFVELFNRSSNPIDLQGWKLSDGSTTATLPSYILMPSARYLIAPTPTAGLFSGAVGVSSFPSLNNTSDNIILKDASNVAIDSITYSLAWYHNDEKKDGGWSLEIIDPENLCGEEGNWKASENVQGGTPGTVNSVLASNPDLVAPQITSFSVLNSTQVEITFNEKLDGNGSLNASANPSLSFSSVSYATSLRKLILTSAAPFLASTSYTVTLSNVSDCAGNGLVNNNFQFVLPEAAQVGDVLINEVLFNPKTGGVDFIEVFNNTNKHISFKKWTLANFENNAVTNPKVISASGLVITPKSFLVFTSDINILKSQYANAIENVCIVNVLPSLLDDVGSVALLDSLGNVIDNFLYNESYHTTTLNSKEGISLERMSLSVNSNDASNWESGSESENFATPGYKNSASYPHFLSSSATNQTSLLILFSETLDATTAQAAANFSVNNGIGVPSAASLQPDNKSVVLTLSTPLTNGLTYTLQSSGVSDTEGDVMPPASISFQYFIPSAVDWRDIVVSEFMADPSPVVGLPESEFIELFNRSANPVDLQGWKLGDGSTSATLPHYILLPSSRCIVAPTTSAGLFSGAIGVANFPSLNNTRDNIVLKNSEGVSIDSITYSQTWYQSDEKRDGGWSLEIIDPENLCGEENNWKASENAQGGTPGVVNSVLASNPDLVAPQITSFSVLNSNQIEITFNEKLDGNGSVNASVNPVFSFTSVSSSTSLRKLILTTAGPFLSSINYTVMLSNVFDCAGNALVNNTLQFVLPEAAQAGDVLINEILFNPRTGGVDFIEVFNNSNKYISLKKWTLTNFENNLPANPKVISSAGLAMSPKSFLVFTSDVTVLKSHYPKTIENVCLVNTLPSMLDNAGSVALVDSLGNIIDHFLYHENYHLASLTIKDGVSLERISFLVSSNNVSNWESGSESENFATPGYKNSASYPHILSASAINQSSLLILFSETLSAATAQTAANFSINNIGNPSSAVLQSDNKSIVLTLSAPLTNGLTYTLQGSGVTDLDGDVMKPGSISFQYFIPSTVTWKDIIVSEIMADPSPVVGLPESEFIELLNRSSNSIDLQGWKLSDGSTTAILPHYVLLPSSRCVVAPSTSAGLFSGAIGVANFPSLNNTSDHIIVKNSTGVSIDSITYFQTWHHSDEKQDGGWSLEIIDPENLCEEEGNWTASENVQGGTPGSVNSVLASNPDVTAPLVEAAIVINPTQLEISFNEKLDGNGLVGASLNPSINFSLIAYSTSLRKLTLTATSPFLSNIIYSLTLFNVFDCAGNALENNLIPIVLPEVAVPGNLLINEILFNPKTGGVDFVEVFNNSDKYISLKKWSLANMEDQAAVNPKEIENQNLVFAPKSFLVFTTDLAVLKAHYPRTIEDVCVTATLPPLSDDEGSIALVDSIGNIIDHFSYRDDYHVIFLKDKDGVSLERVSLTTNTNDANNWRSASQQENFATPGYKNSASSDGSASADGDIWADPEIFSPQVPPNDFTRISYRFNQSGYVANATILDQQGREIKTLANNEVLGTEGFFRWDGDREDGGRARAGYYIAWVEVFNANGQVTTFRKRVMVAFR
jgi:hypothetical protein